MLLAYAGDGKQGSLRVVPVPENEIYHLCDGAGIVLGSIDIEHRYRFGQSTSGETMRADVFSIDEIPCGTRVY